MLPWGKKAEKIKTAERLIKECCAQLEIPEKRLSKCSRDWISRRIWSGEDGEIKHAVYYAVLMASGPEVLARHFKPAGKQDIEAFAKGVFEDMSLEEVARKKVEHFFERLGKLEVTDIHRAVMRQVERPLIETCLEWSGNNQLKAARVLGINRNTLRKKIKELGINKSLSSRT